MQVSHSTQGAPNAHPIGGSSAGLDHHITVQTPISKAGILANIGPNGTKSNGAHAGVVIASPSTTNPNYFFTWIRDGSLVFKLLIDRYTQGIDLDLQQTIDDWVSSQAKLQQISSGSGTPSSGGLGEPRFNVNETANDDDWGRPQYDGPALRAITLVTYGNYLLGQGDASKVETAIWPIVKIDMDFISKMWPKVALDLWEETRALSFFTSIAQHRALRQSAKLAHAMNDITRHDTYTTQANGALSLLQAFWSTPDSHIIANLDINKGRTGLDANTLLGVIHNFDPEAECDSTTFQPCSDRALANHFAVVNSFRAIYPLNSGIPMGRGIAVGRYSEDVYFHGNPWYLTTYAAAEQLYDALYSWHKMRSLEVTLISLSFFKQFLPEIAVGKYDWVSQPYLTIVAGVKQMADEFLLMNARYISVNGAMAEQYDRSTGAPLSAVDLTWSYAASLSAFARRASVVPASWQAVSLVPSPTPYVPSLVPVTFTVEAKTQADETMTVFGNIGGLADFNKDYTLPMKQTDNSTWTLTVSLAASTTIEYQYARKGGVALVVESGPNRVFTTPDMGPVVRRDSWES